MPTSKPSVLLAFAPPYFAHYLKPALEAAGFSVTPHTQGLPPKKSFDLILQATRDSSILAEWTRELLGKAKRDKSRFYLLLFRTHDELYEEAPGFAKSLAAQTHEISAIILNLGRLYGPGIPYEESGALGYLVKEFAEKDFLTVYGDGKDQDYYLYAQDAAIGVGQALKGALPGPIVSLTSPVPVSSESIAKLLFDLGGGRHEIHYHRGIAADDEKGKIEGVPLPKFKTTTAFNDGVLAKLKEDSPSLKPKGPLFHLPPITFKRQERKEKAPARKLTLPKLKIPVAILAAILLPLLYLGLEIGWVAFNFNRAKTELSSLDFPGAQKSLANSAGSLRRLGVIVPPLKIAADLADTVSDVLPPANALSQALENLQKSYQGEAVTPQTENEFKDLSRALNSASQELSIAWLALQDLHPFWSPLSERGEKLIQEDALPALSLLSALADQGYDVLGYKGERSYLLLFQNSAELQPGGGRMGTFANLTLLSGGVKSLKFYNESDYKHISSPLGQFNAISKFPDFRDGARAIADIFARGNGTTTQGVVGVDLRIAQELLSVTGPLTLADFDNQEITAENFFEVTTREVETDFFPGTTKKKRFIQALGEGVLNQLFRTKDYGSISRLVWEGLKEKRLMLYFTKSALYLPALENNFAGRIQETQGDYLFPFDHNAGTKGTVWVKRSIHYRIFNTGREGALRAELKITWKNEGTEAWPGGNYFNRTAVFLPHGAKLIEEKRTSSQDKVLKNFLSGTSVGKTLIFLPYELARYITVPPQSEETLTLIYDLPNTINARTSLYRFYLQKQAGTVADQVKFTFEIPFGYQATPAKVPSQVSLQSSENQLIFEGNLSQDLAWEIELKER